ncbi:uncharacterized protein TNCV_4023551 [Trichonephila clavipes]|nr:uncharacterized protein TNCV_4023551 [Trichonephila clavipes]
MRSDPSTSFMPANREVPKFSSEHDVTCPLDSSGEDRVRYLAKNRFLFECFNFFKSVPRHISRVHCSGFVAGNFRLWKSLFCNFPFILLICDAFSRTEGRPMQNLSEARWINPCDLPGHLFDPKYDMVDAPKADHLEITRNIVARIKTSRDQATEILESYSATDSWPMCQEFEPSATLKIRRVEELMHVKFVVAQNPLIDVMWKFGERWVASSDVIHVTCQWFKMTRSVSNSLRVALYCDINMHSLTLP